MESSICFNLESSNFSNSKSKAASNSNSSKATNSTSSRSYNYSNTVIKDLLLYNTGSTCYIINNKDFFKTFKLIKKSYSPSITTSSSPIYSRGIRTAKFKVLVKSSLKKIYKTLALKDALYFSRLDINLISRLKHYISSRTLIRN